MKSLDAGGFDWTVSAFSYWQAPYRGLLRILAGQQRIRGAFQILERARARHLADLYVLRSLLNDMTLLTGALT